MVWKFNIKFHGFRIKRMVKLLKGEFRQHITRHFGLRIAERRWNENSTLPRHNQCLTIMNREELDRETRATKKTKYVWVWIIGVGMVLMGIAFWGGFFNHDQSFLPGSNTLHDIADDTTHTDTTLREAPAE